MAKQRNSLGVLVLPVPTDTMTWEEYKSKYGVDLESIFEIAKVNTNFIVKVKDSVSKLILLNVPTEFLRSPYGQIPSHVVVPTGCTYEDQSSVEDAYLAFELTPYKGSIYTLVLTLTGDKTISASFENI